MEILLVLMILPDGGSSGGSNSSGSGFGGNSDSDFNSNFNIYEFIDKIEA